MGLIPLFGQFSVGCETSSAASTSSAIADAIPSSSAAASEASRLTEILPVKVNKALYGKSLYHIAIYQSSG